MTREKAIKVQTELLRVAVTYSEVLHERKSKFQLLCEQVQAFRLSNAWQLTPEQHKNYYSWCKWASPKCGLSAQSLICYSHGHQKIKENMRRYHKKCGSLYVQGTSSALLKQAIAIYKNQYVDDKQSSNNKLVGEIALFFIEAHEPKAAISKEYRTAVQ